jgi:hypothetical protein
LFAVFIEKYQIAFVSDDIFWPMALEACVQHRTTPELVEYLLPFDRASIDTSNDYPGDIKYVNGLYKVLESAFALLAPTDPVTRLLFDHAAAHLSNRCKKWVVHQFFHNAILSASLQLRIFITFSPRNVFLLSRRSWTGEVDATNILR